MNTRSPTLWSRASAVGALVILTLIFLGCMSIDLGGKRCTPESGTSIENGVFTQEGTARIDHGEELNVYYPHPYSAIPNLELCKDCGCTILEQHPDHFRIRRSTRLSLHDNVEWKARGVKAENTARQPAPYSQPSPAVAVNKEEQGSPGNR